jgi:hypothetical protein
MGKKILHTIITEQHNRRVSDDRQKRIKVVTRKNKIFMNDHNMNTAMRFMGMVSGGVR